MCINAAPARNMSEVLSTYGAGDMLTGVICTELASGTALNAAIAIANNSAAVHVSRP